MERLFCFALVTLSVPFFIPPSVVVILYWGIKGIVPWKGLANAKNSFYIGIKKEKETLNYYKAFFKSWNNSGWKK